MRDSFTHRSVLTGTYIHRSLFIVHAIVMIVIASENRKREQKGREYIHPKKRRRAASRTHFVPNLRARASGTRSAPDTT